MGSLERYARLWVYERAISMRVISGTAGGRKLQAPEGDQTRPITDRAKEGIFNMLSCYLDFEELTVVDLFAGSGSFGIEALSRGAKRATFVEQRPQAQQTIKKNLDTLGLGDNATILRSSVQQALSQLGPVDLAFCDPPYALNEWATLLPNIPANYVVGHASFEIELTSEWEEIRRRKYGRSRIVIAARIS